MHYACTALILKSIILLLCLSLQCLASLVAPTAGSASGQASALAPTGSVGPSAWTGHVPFTAKTAASARCQETNANAGRDTTEEDVTRGSGSTILYSQDLVFVIMRGQSKKLLEIDGRGGGCPTS